MKKVLMYTILVLSLLAVSACSLQTGETTPPPTDQTDPTPAAEPIFGPGTFTLDLPAGWDVAGPDVITDESNRSYQIYRLGIDPSSSGGPGTSLVIVADAVEWTPEDIALAMCSTCPENGFEEVAVGGKPGLRTEIGGGGVPMVITWTFVENQGKLIAFAIHDPQTLAPLNAVIESIQFE